MIAFFTPRVPAALRSHQHRHRGRRQSSFNCYLIRFPVFLEAQKVRGGKNGETETERERSQMLVRRGKKLLDSSGRVPFMLILDSRAMAKGGGALAA